LLLFAGVVAGFQVIAARAGTVYVDLNSANPVSPYATWAMAATNIQDAVDASVNGDLVLVTNGAYAAGGRMWFGSGTNRVTLTNAVTLRSVNGPVVTSIVGNRVAGSGFALTNAARCVYMMNNAVVSGFTLTNGEAGTGNYPNGGGAMGGTVTNCVLIGNVATNSAGGGAYRAVLIDCQIAGNWASSGGGACACVMSRCTVVSNNAAFGGGVNGAGIYGACILSRCLVAGNLGSNAGGGGYAGTFTACSISNNMSVSGGGVYSSTLDGCLVVSNNASSGGGINGGVISNCTVVLNSATNSGGGVNSAACYNSIVFYNSAPSGSNMFGASFLYCCTEPPNLASADLTTVTNEPLFVDVASGDFHLQSHSPCINSGINRYEDQSADLGGQPRITAGTADIGCYEFQTPSSVISYAWLQRYGFTTDGSADFADSDGDGMSNWQEWIDDTGPTNALSRLVLQPLAPSGNRGGITVTWQSVASRAYYVQRSTNLAQPPPFSTIQSNIGGHSAFTSFTDPSATNTGPYFYRVGVQ
jgi:hypothetical protein